MDIQYERCAGLDVHKQSVVACRITPREGGGWNYQLRSFGTMTADLQQLAEWLREGGVTQVALESTGVYWQPIYNVLEETFSVMLVNAKHIKHVTGRKTDVKDAQWIAEWLQHGLLKASFIPERAQRELRERIRYRTTAGTLLRSQPPAEGPGRCQSQAGVGRHRCAGRVRSGHDRGAHRRSRGPRRVGAIGQSPVT